MKRLSFSVTRRTAAVSLALAAAGLASPSVRAQAKYPDHPVRVILPFGAGGVADVTSRLVAEALSKKLGQNFVIENMPGAGGIAAARAAIAGGKDGYTLTLQTSGSAISAALFEHLPFDPLKDFVPISTIGYFTCDFAVETSSPFKTLGDFLKAARDKPATLNVGTINVGSTQNLTAELFKSMAGVNVVLVPFRGSPDVVVGLLRGDIQMAVDFYAALKPSFDNGQTRALATVARIARCTNGTGSRRRRFRRDRLERALCAGGDAGRNHPDPQQGAARSADRSGAEKTRARSWHQCQGLNTGGTRCPYAQRHRQMGKADRQRAHSEAVTASAAQHHALKISPPVHDTRDRRVTHSRTWY
jgi:tripartite-type tricarboxylate transporter receptor subunit TctC